MQPSAPSKDHHQEAKNLVAKVRDFDIKKPADVKSKSKDSQLSPEEIAEKKANAEVIAAKESYAKKLVEKENEKKEKALAESKEA